VVFELGMKVIVIVVMFELKLVGRSE